MRLRPSICTRCLYAWLPIEHRVTVHILKARRVAVLMLDPSLLVQHAVLGLIWYIIYNHAQFGMVVFHHSLYTLFVSGMHNVSNTTMAITWAVDWHISKSLVNRQHYYTWFSSRRCCRCCCKDTVFNPKVYAWTSHIFHICMSICICKDWVWVFYERTHVTFKTDQQVASCRLHCRKVIRVPNMEHENVHLQVIAKVKTTFADPWISCWSSVLPAIALWASWDGYE